MIVYKIEWDEPWLAPAPVDLLIHDREIPYDEFRRMVWQAIMEAREAVPLGLPDRGAAIRQQVVDRLLAAGFRRPQVLEVAAFSVDLGFTPREYRQGVTA